jgi:hypothetical protein
MSNSLQLNRETHVAPLAVEEAVSASNTANAASITVVLSLVFIIKQVADETCVL